MHDCDFTFLMCSERSGSNLITALVGAHAEFCGPPPSHLIRTLAFNISRYGDLRNDNDWSRLCHHTARLLEASLGAWVSSVSEEELCALEERTPRALIEAVYVKEAAAHDAPRVFIKENQIWRFAPFLLANFPRASFVWLVRDPRDVALSWKRSPNHPGGVVSGAETWREDQREFLELYSSVKASRPSVVLRYEDLITDTEGQMRRLFQGLDANWDPACLHFHESEYVRRNAERLRNWENLARPVLADNRHKYRSDLSAEEIAYVEALCSEEMGVLGYEPESSGGNIEGLRELVSDAGAGAEMLSPREGETKIRERRLAVIAEITRQPPASLF